MRSPFPVACVLLAVSLPQVGAAQDAEYRSFTLSDGRTIVGQVLETGAEGMRVRVPQGIATVPYKLLGDIGTADAATATSLPPIVVAVAPTQAEGLEAQALAARVDGWLGDAAALVPSTRALSPGAWEESLGGGGFELLGCKGRIDCLGGLAVSASADRLLVPSLALDGEAAMLTVRAFVPSGGAPIAEGSSPIGIDPHAHGGGALAAIFAALDIEPEVDVAAVADAEFAPAVVVAPVPEPEPEPTEEPPPDAEAPPEAPATEEPADAPPAAPIAAGGPDEELLRTLALGFAPVPGLNGAVNQDLPAFLVALVGGVGTAWAAVYGVGVKARSPGAFAGPALGAAYGLVVAWNQVAGLTGLAVRRRAGPSASFTVTPLGSDQGAALVIFGTF